MSVLNQPIVKHKLGLLNLAAELGNVAQACKIMGVSRDTFYRYQEAKEQGGVEALLQKDRRRPNFKNRVDDVVEQAVKDYAIEQPAHGQVRVSNELRKRAIIVSPSGVRSIWLRHKLANFKDRLKSLEAHVAATGVVLTESQVQALERKRDDDIACGEIETAHPGYLGSQDTFYVGTMKGVGRIYQQTYVDTYAKVAFAKLYTTKTPLTSADLLNDQVLPFFSGHQVPVLRILTDRGTEYCGKVEQHDYQLYLAMNDIEHTRTKAASPQTNGICERFHKTILQEFYQVAFRKKIYQTIEELQADLDEWMHFYNHERTHQGKMCCGRTPMETFIDGKSICREKLIA
ncbi:IS481 family transposase [Permianibacter aggregans]|uniref:Integrase-like protein n=1 Tax=Permianibacter aggregans TaxID=1510150 RepID=A0A4R6U7U9_9GAMM|nr:IS481 family transposase [Permianibacter aggregans]QGX39853.1 IS481 family transposase [Permianibacter aggregans]QGX39983.1 IS481 family transposase [Permianibacter aggregans]TDQ41003.1 integrase-like protein [Permianibacter aggregans]